ncbi:MAG: riboflavin kinase, partial [Candidatus Aureabacteria bacterium]|nr:riboflavin kinase [Candidatus Auribacterota bacterium]
AVKAYLGRPYSIGGTVRRGRSLGRTWDVRTANIDVSEEKMLLSGVFASRVMIEKTNKVYPGVLSIGANPTVSKEKNQKVEVHILNFSRDLYGKFLEVVPVKKLRRTLKYSNKEKLIQSILKDIQRAKKFFNM